MESILRGKNLPSFKEFARYLFYTATGEEFNEKAINEKTGFIGESKNYEVYLHYKPDTEWLKKNALTLEEVKAFPKFKNKQRSWFLLLQNMLMIILCLNTVLTFANCLTKYTGYRNKKYYHAKAQ